jgi:hypothetical protein
MPPSSSFQTALGRSRRVGLVCFAGLLLLFIFVPISVRSGLLHPVGLDAAVRQTFRIVLFIAAALSALSARLLHGRWTRLEKGENEDSGLRRLGFAALAALSLSLIPAFIGLILVLAAGLVRDFYVLAFISLALLFLYFPRQAAWESALAAERPGCRF